MLVKEGNVRPDLSPEFLDSLEKERSDVSEARPEIDEKTFENVHPTHNIDLVVDRRAC